ncbi:methylthioribulose 1-phosphate dehydratase [Streptomyces luteolus]|uniref:Methylthioribulose-1-phosphate dehydratase n=1 Tax=Streptomyces luteolus TaxID=3043615 RepID=A0ABT6SQZ9_9ACTN|nr:methylthioribulose 1-phosphate dehydratase [Streptomyces sp. B-S-A12]MDI3418016.1 methylthioribulose 1-phosphate dehydratase [Streptomyces sp. B-S-A12]
MAVSTDSPRSGTGVELERGQVAAACRDMFRRGWMPGTAGNVSVRVEGRVVISASGRAKGTMSMRDTVAVSAPDGLPLSGESKRPSAETAIHLAVYQTVPEADAVVHTHAPYSTALSAGIPVGGRAEFNQWELAKGLGVRDHSHVAVPVFANWADVPRIGRDVAAHLRDAGRNAPAVPALLISRHGVTTWGRDLTEAVNRLECVEMLCRLVLMTSGGRALPDGPESEEAP